MMETNAAQTPFPWLQEILKEQAGIFKQQACDFRDLASPKEANGTGTDTAAGTETDSSTADTGADTDTGTETDAYTNDTNDINDTNDTNDTDTDGWFLMR